MSLNKKDYQNANEVKWCPGCGDYAILATVQKTLADLGIARENCVFVSGIGCASRFPYYMNTYGLHTIHGRAPAIASGIKFSRPDLKVFLVTGDGDGLSIGASHLLHLFRRNIDLTVLLFNNQIYGLTKGQYSPTSARGHRAKSTPFGSIEEPINPTAFAIASKASFVARTVDNHAQHLGLVLKEAANHKGTSFVEILQTCVVFNDGAFDHVRDKDQREKNTLTLNDHEPLLFDRAQKGLALNHETLSLEVVDAAGPKKSSIVTHDPRRPGLYPSMLADLSWPQFPVPIGIFRQVEGPSFEDLKRAQDADIKEKFPKIDLKTLLMGQNTWEI